MPFLTTEKMRCMLLTLPCRLIGSSCAISKRNGLGRRHFFNWPPCLSSSSNVRAPALRLAARPGDSRLCDHRRSLVKGMKGRQGLIVVRSGGGQYDREVEEDRCNRTAAAAWHWNRCTVPRVEVSSSRIQKPQ